MRGLLTIAAVAVCALTTSSVVTAQSCPTLESNVDYYGDDLRSVSTSDIAGCCSACNSAADCKAFTYASGVCYMKKGSGTRKTVSGVTSGVKTTASTCPALLSGVDYYGNDIGSVANVDQAGCCTACNSNSNCKAFTYASGVCYLKSSTAGQKSAASSVVSGVKGSNTTPAPTTPVPTTPTPTTPTPTTPTPTTPAPTTPAPSTCPTLEANVDYYGEDLRSVVTDLAGCCSACNNAADCNAFTYASGVCYLKKGTGTRKSASGVYSGVKATTSTCPSLLPGVDYYGNDLRSVSNVDQTGCCAACNSAADCKAFTYVTTTKVCYLKSSSAGQVAGGSNVVSGIKGSVTPTPTTPTPTTPTPTPTTPTPTTPTPPASCPTLEANVDYYGGDLRTVSNVDQAGCCTACNNDASCKGFTYIPASSACYLKKTIGTKSSYTGAYSGVKATTCPALDYNTDYYGNDYKSVSGVTLESCCSTCNSESSCKVFTFVPSSSTSTTGACYLKNAVGAKSANSGATSGVKSSTTPTPTTPTPAPPTCVGIGGTCGGTTTCCDSSLSYCQPWSSTLYQCMEKPAMCAAGLETDVDYNGNDLQYIGGVDLAGCCEQCNLNSACKAFTYATGWNGCYLKTAGGNKKAAQGMISGVRSDSTPAPTTPTPTTAVPTPSGPWDTARCGTQKLNVYYHGSDIAGSEKSFDTVEECCDYCKSNNNCKLFTYFSRGSTKKCVLRTGTKNTQKTSYSGVQNAYVTSGIFA